MDSICHGVCIGSGCRAGDAIVRVLASKAAMADAGIASIFDAIVWCFGRSGEIESTRTEKRRRRHNTELAEAPSAQS
jgi:hypothetical protein